MKLTLVLLSGLLGIHAARLGPKAAPDCIPEQCNNQNCRCFSPGTVPGGLASSDIPQIVLVTFDDAVTRLLYDTYYSQAFENKANPNGCPYTATFFTSHEYTDYQVANLLRNRGHEIALHSISHTTTPEYWNAATVESLKQEIAEQRDMMSHFANIPASEIQGFRIPFLQLGGDPLFQMLTESSFLYDCTWPTQTYIGDGLFPYTLDYKSGQDCNIGKCPVESHPGAWVLPMVDWLGSNGRPCAMVDTCTMDATTEDQMLDFFKTNFHRHYDNFREPFGFYVHAAWFNADNMHYLAFERFLQYLDSLNDVYVVTAKQAIEWAKNPTNIAGAANTFACPALEPATCEKKTCTLQKPNEGERIMVSCVPCPPNYPWVGNPLGQ